MSTEQHVKSFWVGIDVSKSSFDAATYLPHVAMSNVPSFPRTREGAAQLLHWSEQLAERHIPGARIRVVMEATGSYSIQLLAWLLELRPDCAPAIINPSYIKAFGQSLGGRNKTDKADARVIARYGCEREPAPEQVPDADFVRLRALVRERAYLVEMITAEKNRSAEPAASDLIQQLRTSRLDTLKQQLKTLEKQIRTHVANTPKMHHDVELLDSVPGVGFIAAVTVLAELGDLRRFPTARKLAAFSGMSPRRNQSGKTEKQTRLCRMGNANVRPVLHLGARSLTKHDSSLGQFYRQLVSRGKTKKAANAAVSRKILLLMRAVLVNNCPYDGDYHAPPNSTSLVITTACEGLVA